MYKLITWDEEKNDILKKQRWVSFEDIKIIIKNDDIIDIYEEHYNKDKYPNQKIIFVNIKNYIYIVPFIEDKEEIFLKTIIPSRKYTKIFLNK